LEFNLWRGVPRRTSRELKLAAAKQVGLVVPVVRCPYHGRGSWLNLAMNGQIYASGLYWEKNVANDVDALELGALLGNPQPLPTLSPAAFPARDRHAEAQLLDLTGFYNATLTNSWQGFPGNHLGRLPSGVQTLDGVRFDIRGVIQLGAIELPNKFPKRVDGIPVAQKCRRIHFLHAASYLYRTNTLDGLYVIHYTDGREQQIPLLHGQEIADWWRDPKRATRTTKAKEVWSGLNEAAEAYGKVLCLHRFTWDNPRKETPIATLSFVSAPVAHTPFVVAITVE